MKKINKNTPELQRKLEAIRAKIGCDEVRAETALVPGRPGVGRMKITASWKTGSYYETHHFLLNAGFRFLEIYNVYIEQFIANAKLNYQSARERIEH